MESSSFKALHSQETRVKATKWPYHQTILTLPVQIPKLISLLKDSKLQSPFT